MFATALDCEQVQTIISFVASTASQVNKLSQKQYRGIELAWREYLQSFDPSLPKPYVENQGSKTN